MGNMCYAMCARKETIETKRHTLPKSTLKEVRRKMNKHLKEIALAKTHRTPSMIKKEQERSTTELNKKSVVNYLMLNPDFLDSLVINYISQDRVKAWLKEAKEKAGESAKDETDKDWTAELMEKSFRHRQILTITRSHLFYPAKYNRDQLNELIAKPYSDEYDEEVDSHLFPYTEVPVENINNVFILMVRKLLGKFAFPETELCYFLCCLQSNYHNIEYHNYSHALSHAQSMYWILNRNLGVFNELEVKSLMISAIAHDVGHAGVNDDFLKATKNGLEKLYFSPILEHHHTQTTFLILQDIGCNVFCNLEGDDYKMVLDEIKHNILSTSLARYKVQCENMNHIIGTGPETGVDFENKRHRDAIKSVLMMTCDLCASWKEWPEHENTVSSLYKEFFSQGDQQKNMNIPSIPQMQRKNSDKIPKYQVEFMENILIPVFKIASKVFPNISEIVDCTKENMELWKDRICIE